MNKTSHALLALAATLLFCLGLVACDGADSGTEETPQTKDFPRINMEPIPDFQFTDQDSQAVTPATVTGKVHIVDFFFTSCPTICPIMKTEMLKVYEAYETESDFIMLSHSIDTRHDSVSVLHDYAERLGVNSDRWRFMTGEKDDIFFMAEKYLISAMEDSLSPGGYTHSGKIILLDENRDIRAYYDGTDPEDTDKMIGDIQILLNELKGEEN